MFQVTDMQKIGVGLAGFGVAFLFLGVVLLFDRGLLAIGNILFIAGLGCVIGIERTFRFFFQRHKLKASTAFFGGIFVVLFGYPIIGMIVEMYGFVLLFSGFFPAAINFLRRVPILGTFLNMPGINMIVVTLICMPAVVSAVILPYQLRHHLSVPVISFHIISLWNTLDDLEDVGHLTVKVHKATGLAAADFGVKSDPFCVLELGNTRLQTRTEGKTLSPVWEEVFSFDVKDINSVLEVTVFDEDWDKVDFLGKVSIPLLRICSGEQKWYCLKDKNLIMRAKGNNPMILLEMDLVWNPIRGCIRSLNPKEKYEEEEIKFKIPVFVKNVLRLKAIIMAIIAWGKTMQEYCNWDNPAQNAVVLAAYITICYCFKPYMIPAVLAIIFLKYYIILGVDGNHCSTYHEDEVVDDNEEDEDKEKEEKKSLKQRLHEIQEVTQTVQNVVGQLASLGEKVKNTFNFTVPFISYIAMGLVFIAVVIVYYIPLRYIIMSIGVIKIVKKMIRPRAIPNNEVIDLLSRVPDDVEVMRYRELRQNSPRDVEGKKEEKKK